MQGEQVPACSGAGDARALGGERRIEPLTLGVKRLQHGHAFDHAFNEIGFGNAHGAVFAR